MLWSSRREWLRTIGVIGIAGVAGCSTSEEGSQPDNNETIPGATDTDESLPDGETATAEPSTETEGNTETDTAERQPTETGNGSRIDGAYMFQYDAANTGHTPTETGPEGEITEQWSTFVGNDGAAVRPAVANGHLYVGTSGGTVAALDAGDGTVQWSIDTGTAIETAPAIRNGTLYVGNQSGKFYALDTADGSKQWRFDTGNYPMSTPTIVDDTVYFGKDQLYALGADDGSVQWQYKPSDTGSIEAAPAVVDDTVFVGDTDRRLYAIDTNDGSEKWQFEANGDIEAAPTVADGTVFVGSQEGISSPAVFYAIDAVEGTQQWSVQTDRHIAASAAVNQAKDTVYFASREPAVYALSIADGGERWRFKGDTNMIHGPVVVDGTVYVNDAAPRLYALDAKTGAKDREYDLGGFDSGPVVVDGNLYISASSVVSLS